MKENRIYGLSRLNLSAVDFVSTDETRAALCGLHVNVKDKKVVSTNGHILTITALEELDKAEVVKEIADNSKPVTDSFTIPAETVKTITQGLPKNPRDFAALRYAYIEKVVKDNGNETVTISTHNLESYKPTQFKHDALDYNDNKLVIQDTKPDVVVSFDPDVMGKLCKWWSKHVQKETYHKRIDLECWKKRHSFRVVDPETKTTVVLMGVRNPNQSD